MAESESATEIAETLVLGHPPETAALASVQGKLECNERNGRMGAAESVFPVQTEADALAAAGVADEDELCLAAAAGG